MVISSIPVAVLERNGRHKNVQEPPKTRELPRLTAPAAMGYNDLPQLPGRACSSAAIAASLDGRFLDCRSVVALISFPKLLTFIIGAASLHQEGRPCILSRLESSPSF
jgi:hypothetical protein